MYETNFNVTGELQNSLVQICAEKDVHLTEYAQRFLLITAECFLVEVPKHAEREMSPPEWVDIGKDILADALDDPRARKEMSQRSEVSFATLFHTVAEAGHKRLAMIGFK